MQWRNPRLHDAARIKLWHACESHADELADFLDRRGFLLGRVARLHRGEAHHAEKADRRDAAVGAYRGRDLRSDDQRDGRIAGPVSEEDGVPVVLAAILADLECSRRALDR